MTLSWWYEDGNGSENTRADDDMMSMDYWVVNNREMMVTTKVGHMEHMRKPSRPMPNLLCWCVWELNGLFGSESLLIVVEVADQCHITHNYWTRIIIVSQHLCCRPQYRCSFAKKFNDCVRNLQNAALSLSGRTVGNNPCLADVP